MGNLGNPWATKKKITWSVMERWLSCRRRWYYRYIGRFAPSPGMPLMVGSLLHACFEDEALLNKAVQAQGWGLTDNEADNREADLQAYARGRIERLEIAGLFDAFKVQALAPFANIAPGMFSPDLPSYTAEDVDTQISLVRDLFTNYLALRGAEDLRRYKVIDAEIRFDGLKLPKLGGGMLRGWTLGGMVDQLLQDRNTGALILREIKSTGGSASDYERRVELDPQVRLYAQAIEMLGHTGGQPVQEVQYLVVRKKTPTIPRDVTCPSCKNKDAKRETCDICGGLGVVPSTDKRLDGTSDTLLQHLETRGFARKLHNRKPTDVHVYCQHTGSWYVDLRYAELAQGQGGWEKFISLTTHYLNADDKAEALWEAVSVAHEITDAVRRHRKKGESHVTTFPRNIGKCTGPGGYCEYKQVCIARYQAEEVANAGGGWATNLPDHPELETHKEK